MYNSCRPKGKCYFTAPSLAVYDRAASVALGKDYDRIINPWEFHLNDNDKTHIKIPAGMLTDNASVPRIFWISLPPRGPYSQAAHGHDKVCETLEVYKGDVAVPVTRQYCDELLDLMLFTLEISPWERKKIMFGVNLYRNTIGTSKPNPNYIKESLERQYYSSPIAKCIMENADIFKEELLRLNTSYDGPTRCQ